MVNKEIPIITVPIARVEAADEGAVVISPSGRKIGIVPEGESLVDPRGTSVQRSGGLTVTRGPDGRISARLPGSPTGSVIKI